MPLVPPITPAPPRSTVLIVDDSGVCRGVFDKLLGSEGFATVMAVDGLDALKHLATQHVDAVLLDYDMPKMNGLAFLKILRADARFKTLPVIMLTASFAKEVILDATRFGISGYLLKAKLSLPDMVARLRQAIIKSGSAAGAASAPVVSPTAGPIASTSAVPAPASTVAPDNANSPSTAAPLVAAPSTPVAPPVPRKRPEQVKMSVPNFVPKDVTLSAITELATGRKLADELARIGDAADVSKANISQIAAIAKQDARLSARLIQIASSPGYGDGKTKVVSVDDAIRVLGASMVRQLTVAMAVLGPFTGEAAGGVELLRCWQHAVAVASIMGRLVSKTETGDAGVPYLIGLCHDLPEMMLRQRYPAEYAAAADFGRQVGMPANRLMKQVFGVPHAEIVDIAFNTLKLPNTINDAIREYEHESHCPADSHGGGLARALAIANFLAHGVGCTASIDESIAPVQLSDCRTALISSNPIDLAEIMSEATRVACALANATPAQQAALKTPMVTRREVKVWYTRHASFAGLDSIEGALSGLCRLQVQDRLPVAEELAGLRGLVIVSPEIAAGAAVVQRLCEAGQHTLPILNITRIDPELVTSPPPGAVEEIAYPLPLSRLAAWVTGLAA